MFPKISSRLLVCYFAVLLVAFPGQPSDGATYADFARQHMDYPRTPASNPNAYCNHLMAQRGMTKNSCKMKNTFMHDDPSNIQSICSEQPSGKLCDSKESFPLTFCHNRGHHPNCNYIGRQMTSRVRVGCINGLPVHFETDL